MIKEVNTMLLKFSIENYKSIGNSVELNMIATTAREHKDFLLSKNNVHVLPTASIYGPNASGKSNILEAINFFKIKILSSHIESFNKAEEYQIYPFLFDETLKEKPTTFDAFLTIDEKEYHYGFKIKNQIILQEYLEERKFSKNETKWKTIFSRKEQKIQYSTTKKYAKLAMYNSLITPQMLVVTFLGQKDSPDVDAFSNIYLWAIDGLYILEKESEMPQQSTLAQYYKSKKVCKSLTNFIGEFDPCIEKIIIEEEENTGGFKTYKAFTVHQNKKFDLKNESDGTKKLISLYLRIVLALETGGLLVVDELDAKLHPLILRKIVQTFHDPETNKNNAQLIFTSHNLILFNNKEMRRDEIWLTEKDNNGYTTLYSLADFNCTAEEIRSDLDYGKHYLLGRFGAIPFDEWR